MVPPRVSDDGISAPPPPPASSSSLSSSWHFIHRRSVRKATIRQRQRAFPRPFLLAIIVLLSFLISDVPVIRKDATSSSSSTSSSSTTFRFASAVTITTITLDSSLTDEDESKQQRMGRRRTSSTLPSSSSSSSSSPSPSSSASLNQILWKAGKRGLGGGIPGAIAGVVQVLTLMWLRTVTNYQYRYGTTFLSTLRTLYTEGGITRFYRGVIFALIQAPLARFGSTAANDGVEALVSSLQRRYQFQEDRGEAKGTVWEWVGRCGPGTWGVAASLLAGMWRVVIMPVDTCKTVLQVDAAEGFRNLMRKVRVGKIGVLYQGAIASAISTLISHYPWFYTYNVLSKNSYLTSLIPSSLLRNSAIGFLASVVSDTVSNCIRVVKTTKQAVASKHVVNYGEAIAMVLAADGWKGLLGRGLRTRILGNGFQSIVFTVVWRGLAGRGIGNKGDQHGHHNDSDSESDSESEGMLKDATKVK